MPVLQWFKGYLNEVGRKPDQQQYDYGHGFKGYLNKVGRKLKPIDLHDLKGYLNEVGRKLTLSFSQPKTA